LDSGLSQVALIVVRVSAGFVTEGAARWSAISSPVVPPASIAVET
jgi:hypothetical protein